MARPVVAPMDRAIPIPDTGCWLYEGGLDPDGYGIAFAGNKKLRAHRRSWELAFGLIPEGLCVLHRCDTPACVNPKHLFLGTPTDNHRDREAKCRGAFSKARGMSLTSDAVAEIRKSCTVNGLSQAAIGTRFGISQSAVSRIVCGKIWKDQ